MSSNLARTGLAAALVAAAALTGCNVGRDDHAFVPESSVTKAPVLNAAAPAAAPVVPAAPVVSGASAGQPAAVAADPGGAAADAAAVRKAAHQRKVARRQAREAKRREHRAQKRAAHREAVLRAKLREARRQQALAAAQQQLQSENAQSSKPKTSDKNKISASDVETQADRDRRADTEARAAVVRYHELLDHHDPAACDLLTPQMLHSFYGNDEPGATQRCRSGVQSINQRVSVQILRSAASGTNALLDTVTYMGTYSVHQGLALVLVDGTWKIDAVKQLDN